MTTADRSAALARAGLAAALVVAAPLAQAIDGITDPAGDFLPTFGGNPATSAYLDVVSASVLYNAGTDIFTLVSTLNGAIPTGPSVTGFYVWGANRGAGTAGFAANGITGVRFDAVVVLRLNGTTSTANGTALPASAVTVAGNTISASFSGSLLPSTGFANKLDYTWNLWPRDAAFAGFAQISDFAPNNSNFTATPVPEPSTAALMLGGVGVLGWWGGRSRRTKPVC